MIYTSQILVGASGSVNGLTFSRNKGGWYTKAKAVPTNPNSSRQQATRAQLGSFAGKWSNDLTQAQRDAWNAFAQAHTIKNALGEDIFINGINWWIMFNTRLFDAGLAGQAWPPILMAPPSLTTFSCDISAANTVDVTFTPAMGVAEGIQLWQTLPGSAGQTPNFKQARLVGYSPLAQASPWAATLPFGVQSGSQAVFYGIRYDDTGQVSVPLVHTDLADY